ncbi:hypothetical protein KFU94_04050 [Chloroflexi bacterium TSY]|nr:hypothetical protein [Chloroflexi bacterium TSY]
MFTYFIIAQTNLFLTTTLRLSTTNCFNPYNAVGRADSCTLAGTEDITIYTSIVISFGLGIALSWLIASATARWRRGRGLILRPQIVRSENIERMRDARNNRAQGWRELWRASGEWLIVVILVFLLGIIWGGVR